MSFLACLRKVLAKPSNGEVRQATQVNVSGSALLKSAARQQSAQAKQVEYEVRAHLRDEQPAAQTLTHLVDFMSRGSDASSR